MTIMVTNQLLYFLCILRLFSDTLCAQIQCCVGAVVCPVLEIEEKFERKGKIEFHVEVPEHFCRRFNFLLIRNFPLNDLLTIYFQLRRNNWI